MASIASIAVASAFGDRPIASWVASNLDGHGISTFVTFYRGRAIPVTPATLLVAPGELASLAGAYGVIPLAVIWWSRHGSPAWLRNLFSACLSTALTLAAVEPLKGVFGRTWPESWAGFNPSWIRDGVYGFHWFHQGIAYQSFPSGHMAAICSFVVPLWLAYPRLRWACVVCCLMVATGLLGGNYHFLSDILAGAVLGLAGGILATRLLAPALSGRQLER